MTSKPISATASRRLAAVHEGAAGDLAGLRVLGGALGAGEELVPAAVERALPVGVQRVGALDRDELAQRVAVEQLGSSSGSWSAASRASGGRLVSAARGDRARQRPAWPRASAGSSACATRSSSSRPSVNISSTSTPAGIFRLGGVLPGGDRVRPRVHLERPRPCDVGGDPGVVVVGRAGVLGSSARAGGVRRRGRSGRRPRRACRGPRGTRSPRRETARRASPSPAVDRGRRRA